MPIQTPDSIGRSLTISKTALDPAARAVSVYQGGTRSDVAEPPQGKNSYQQLGDALSNFSATTGVKAVSYLTDIQTQKDLTEGQIKAQELAKDSSIANLKEAQAKGLIPNGASPNYLFAANANYLKLRGEQAQVRWREDYYNNAALRNDDTPGAYEKAFAEWQSTYDKANLQDAEGNPLYSSLELQASHYNTRLTDGGRAVEQEHIAHRVSERETLAEANTTALIATRLDQLAGSGINLRPPEERDNAGIARAMVDVGYNGQTGASAIGGMNKSKFSVMLQDAVLAKAVSEKKVDLLEIADHIQTPGGRLSDTTRFKEKAQLAREHIASQLYTEYQHKQMQAMNDAEGTLEERAKIHGDQYRETANEASKRRLVNNFENMALNFKSIIHMTPQERLAQQAAIDQMREVSPKAANTFEQHLTLAREHFQNAENKDKFPLGEMGLHNAMLLAPGTPATNGSIDQALRDKRIGGSEWLRLRADSDRMGQAKTKYAHILDDEFYKNLEREVGRATYNNPGEPFGAAATEVAAAKFEFRRATVDIIEANPKATALQIAAMMEPNVKAFAEKHNSTMKELVEQEKVQQKTRDLIVEQALSTSQVKEILANETAPGQTRVNPKTKEKFEQPRAVTDQIIKATGEENRAKAADKKAAEPVKFAPKNEASYQQWKEKYAKDTEFTDSDLRELFKAGKKPTTK